MHICYVENGYPRPGGGGGGAGTYVQLIGRELVLRGHSVSVVAAWYSGCEQYAEDQGVVVYRPPIEQRKVKGILKLPGLWRLQPLWGIFTWQRRFYHFIEEIHHRQPIDLLEITEGRDFWHALQHSIPYIAHLHGSGYTFKRMQAKPVNWMTWITRQIQLVGIRRADWVISPSQALLAIVRREAQRALLQASVLPYPLDPRLLAGEPRPTCQSHRTILFAARNTPVKGGDVLMQAVPAIRKEFPDVEFRFFGYQPQADQEIPAGVICFPFVPKDELLTHYRQVDICVVPSLWDNSPNTVYEAMAAGKPVVASRVGGIPEIVLDGETGLLVEPGDVGGLVNALCTLLADDAHRMQMGEKGLQRIQQLADLRANVDQRLALYVRIATG